jgi:hypothetical protein
MNVQTILLFLKSKVSLLIFLSVTAVVVISSVATVAVVLDSPTDPTIAPETTTFDGSGSEGSGFDSETTTPDDGSGSNFKTTTVDDGSGESEDESLKIIKVLKSNPTFYEEDFISEGFIQLNQY